MKHPEVLSQLVEHGQAGLASWFGVPLTVEHAQAALAAARQGFRHVRAAQHGLFTARLADLIFRYWAGYDIEANYRNFLALLGDEREYALLELCYGQLLMACKQEPAWRHLDKGFAAAAHLLEPEDYFTVLKRHELLRQLPLAALPSEAAPLEALLAEARVISRLRGAAVHPDMRPSKHTDTVD
jgi:hypothetical protein